MIMACTMAVVFAKEHFSSEMSHSGHLQPTSRVLRACTTEPQLFIVTGLKDQTNTVISSEDWICTINDVDTVSLTPVNSVSRTLQNCSQGPASIKVFNNRSIFTLLTDFTDSCIISSTGTISFTKK